MKHAIKILSMTVLLNTTCLAQEVKTVIDQVMAKQQTLSQVSYVLQRTDTIGPHIRQMKGKVIMERYASDQVFGFKFWSKKINDPLEKIYDGHAGYEVNIETNSYEMTTSAIGLTNLLNGGGGHLVFNDLMKLDTAGVLRMTLSNSPNFYKIKFTYPDLEKYDVTNRFKEVQINKETMLPLSVRHHQESLGRIQDLYFEITQLNVLTTEDKYRFEELPFLKTFKHKPRETSVSPVAQLIGTKLPDMKLPVFVNGSGQVSLSEFQGKVLLLDFWEVWCLPCVESMPKVEALYQKYKAQGLLVYGIVNDHENVNDSKALVNKKKIQLPMLLGNDQLREALRIHSIPLYMLIDQTGKIAFFSVGYTEEIEAVLVNLLKK